MDIAKQLNETLEMIAERFQLPQDSKKATWKNPFIRARFNPGRVWEVGVLASYRNENIAKIRQWNADLNDLTNGGRKSFSRPNFPNPPKIDISLVAYHKRIQDHARFLYGVLRERLETPGCECGLPHNVYLELQMRRTPPAKAFSKSRADILGPNKFLAFNLLFTREKGIPEWTIIWQEFQLEHIDECKILPDSNVKRSFNTSSDKLPTIHCLCTSIATYTTTYYPVTSPPTCIGLVTGIDNKKYRIWPSLRTSPSPSRMVSLTDLITTRTNTNTPNRQDRLVLALKLAYAVLQLSTTEWLTEIWEARDIFFSEPDLNAPGQYEKILSRPFVHQKFSVCSGMNGDSHPQSLKISASQTMRGFTGCNQSLYSLAIILLEIWHWRTFSSMFSSSGMGQSEVLFAYHLSEQLSHEAGYQYSIAVRRCIRGFDMPASDLENDSFRKVYEDLLGPLEDDLKMFCQCDDLKDVIGEE